MPGRGEITHSSQFIGSAVKKPCICTICLEPLLRFHYSFFYHWNSVYRKVQLYADDIKIYNIYNIEIVEK